MTEYLLDTWAWIEFYTGSEKGEKIYQILESDEKCYTSIISLAELSDNFHSGNLESDHSWNQIRKFVEAKTKIIKMDPETCGTAGKTKNKERKKHPDISLMDTIILSQAREKELKTITGDKHLQNREETAEL
jgi:PIN domain nuclease of toxin-antitoxin system